MKITKLYAGCFRISNGIHFGHIKKVGRQWHAEIRTSETGTLRRYAGIWDRKADAIEEVESLLRTVEYRG